MAEAWEEIRRNIDYLIATVDIAAESWKLKEEIQTGLIENDDYKDYSQEDFLEELADALCV